MPSISVAESEVNTHQNRSCHSTADSSTPVLTNLSNIKTNAQTSAMRGYHVIARYPHDSSVFTQGLAYHQGDLYESVGLRGYSSVRRLALKSGEVLATKNLDKTLFGEGLTVADNRLIQLTWQSGKAIMYKLPSLQKSGSFAYDGEGWGVTVIDKQLVLSDGSSWLKFLSIKNYQQLNRLQVTDHGQPVEGINELEIVDGVIFANIYPTDCIAQIDASTGQVLGWLDLRGLMPLSDRPDSTAVANGIAYNKLTKDIYVTGKYWPYIFQLRLQTSQSAFRKNFFRQQMLVNVS